MISGATPSRAVSRSSHSSASTVKRAILTSAPGDLSEGNILKSLCIIVLRNNCSKLFCQ